MSYQAWSDKYHGITRGKPMNTTKKAQIDTPYGKKNWEYIKGLMDADTEANARLISASPELLSALEESREYISLMMQSSDDDNGEGELLYRIEQAIKKAKGE